MAAGVASDRHMALQASATISQVFSNGVDLTWAFVRLFLHLKVVCEVAEPQYGPPTLYPTRRPRSLDHVLPPVLVKL
eukprot:3566838-Amphidinium_carterae.1